MRAEPRLRSWGAVGVVALLLSGCAGPSAPAPSTRTPAPDAAAASATGSVDQKQLALADCLRQRGWDVRVSSGGLGVDYPASQADRFHADEQACISQAGMDAAPPTVSSEEAAWLYDEFLRITPCVEAKGIPVAPPPSKGAFVEQLTAHPIPAWHPYDGAPDRVTELAKDCPVAPWPGR